MRRNELLPSTTSEHEHADNCEVCGKQTDLLKKHGEERMAVSAGLSAAMHDAWKRIHSESPEIPAALFTFWMLEHVAANAVANMALMTGEDHARTLDRLQEILDSGPRDSAPMVTEFRND